MTIDARTGLKLLIADEEPLVREAFARLAGELGTAAEVLEAASVGAAEAVAIAHPDLALVVLDVSLPDAPGVEAVARVLQASPGTPILVLTSRDDSATARAALDAGARGFISKRSPTRVLVEALRLVLVGGMYVPPQALRAPADGGAAPASDPANGINRSLGTLSLTPRQRDVLALLMQGKPNKMICRELALAEGTVKTHTAAIYRALGVTNRTQAVYAMSRLGADFPVATSPLAGEANAAGPETRPTARATTRARAAAESLRTVTSRLHAAADGGRWAAMLGLQPV